MTVYIVYAGTLILPSGMHFLTPIKSYTCPLQRCSKESLNCMFREFYKSCWLLKVFTCFVFFFLHVVPSVLEVSCQLIRETQMKRYLSVIVIFITIFLSIKFSGQAQTPVSTVSGSSYSFTVSRGILAAAFEQEFNDGSTVDSASIYMVKSGSSWFLWGIAMKSGKIYTCWIPLDVSDGYSYIFQGAGGKVSRCHHPACNYFPCTLPPVCAGECNNDGVECVLITDDQVSSGYLGTFH